MKRVLAVVVAVTAATIGLAGVAEAGGRCVYVDGVVIMKVGGGDNQPYCNGTATANGTGGATSFGGTAISNGTGYALARGSDSTAIANGNGTATANGTGGATSTANGNGTAAAFQGATSTANGNCYASARGSDSTGVCNGNTPPLP